MGVYCWLIGQSGLRKKYTATVVSSCNWLLKKTDSRFINIDKESINYKFRNYVYF